MLDFFMEKILLPACMVLMFGCFVALIYEVYQELKPPSITEGRVTELEHLPESEDVVLMPIVISTGKTTSTMMVPTYIHNPESFRVVIKDGDKTEDFYVDKKTYKQLKIGYRFRAEGDVKDERPEETRDATDAEIKKMEEK